MKTSANLNNGVPFFHEPVTVLLIRYNFLEMLFAPGNKCHDGWHK